MTSPTAFHFALANRNNCWRCAASAATCVTAHFPATGSFVALRAEANDAGQAHLHEPDFAHSCWRTSWRS